MPLVYMRDGSGLRCSKHTSLCSLLAGFACSLAEVRICSVGCSSSCNVCDLILYSNCMQGVP